MDSVFFYQLTLHRDTVSATTTGTWVTKLPLVQQVTDQVVILTGTEGLQTQGMYVYDGTRWRFTLPYPDVCAAIIEGASIDVFYDVQTPFTQLPARALVWRNALPNEGTTIAGGDGAVWTALTPPQIGNVDSVNGALPDANGNVVVPVATTTVAGTVKAGSGLNVAGDGTLSVNFSGEVKSVDGQAPDGNGNVVIKAQDNNDASGTTLIVDGGATTGLIKFKTIVAGSGITLSTDASGNMEISGSSQFVLPVATATVLGGVKQGANVTIASDGTISVAAPTEPYTLPAATTTTLGGIIVGTNLTINAGVLSATAAPYTLPDATTTVLGGVTVPLTGGLTVTAGALALAPATASQLGGVKQGANIEISGDGTISAVIPTGGLTAVNSEGTGTSLVGNNGSSGGIALLKSLAAGSNITITPDGANQTLTISANQSITPATTSAIGGVIVGTGLSVQSSGLIALVAPTGVNLGGVKAGTGITIASDGTISSTATGNVASVSGQTGTVVIEATDNSDASGTSLISNSGATTGNIKLKTLVAGANVTIAPDGNGNLSIASTGGASYTLPPATTSVLGGVIVGSGLAVTVGGVLSATAQGGGVTSIAAGTSGNLVGAITFSAGQSISLSNNGNTIQINGTGVPEAPNDGNQYGRQNQGWTIIPALGSAITSVTGQAGTGAILMVESSPPANSAIIKSLLAGTNVTLTDNSGVITVAASIPGGTVATVNSVAPNTSGNVTLTAASVSALALSGGNMAGPINMESNALTGLPTPVNASDAVTLSYLQAIVINGGVIG